MCGFSPNMPQRNWDPVKNLCKCRVNSPHKINCDPKMRWCTVFLRTIKYIELSLWQWHCWFPRHTYIRPTSSRPYLLGCLKVVFQDPWSFGYHILHFHRLTVVFIEATWMRWREAKSWSLLQLIQNNYFSSTKLRLIKSAAIGAVTKCIIILNSESCH